MQASALLAACLAASACGESSAPQRDLAPPGPASDAAPRADGRIGVDCLGAGCEPGAHCCAFRVLERPPRYGGVCYAPGDGGPCEEIVVECDGPEDCASGEVCCDGARIRCLAEAECQNAVICHTDDHCEGGRRCAPTPRGIIDACQ